MLKTFFRWAVSEEFIRESPVADLKPPSKNVERDRALSDDEIVAVWSGCDKIGWPYGPLFKLLLLTAQRRNEVGRMEWSEIDDKDIWTIPGKRAKNGKPHIVHLSRLAVEIIASVPRINGSKYVFTTAGETPVNGWSASKSSLDKHVAVEEAWTLHDLRRTAASGMAQLGIAPQVVDKVLNHTAGTIKGVARIYNRYEYGDERKASLEAWSRHVESLLHPAPSNVVAIAKSIGERS
jgi:integrase